MNLSHVFDGLQLPKNEDINLALLLGPLLAESWAAYPDLAPWTKDEQGQLLPFYPHHARLEQVQVLGLNPSYTASDRVATDYPVDFTRHPYFRRMGGFMQRIVDEHQQLQDADTEATRQLYHFGELSCGHLDLLYMRATNQQALEAQIWNTPKAADFIWQQLQLTKRLLAALQPITIVVANRFGQRLTGFHKNKQTGANEWMGWQFTEKPDERGAYRITGSTTAHQPDPENAFGLAGTPVFFTNSFAGTSPRNKKADKQLADQIAKTCLLDGNRYFEQWHMK